jgi:hypothetical protein
MAAATEASLMEYNQGMAGNTDSGGATVAEIPGDTTSATTSIVRQPRILQSAGLLQSGSRARAVTQCSVFD